MKLKIDANLEFLKDTKHDRLAGQRPFWSTRCLWALIWVNINGKQFKRNVQKKCKLDQIDSERKNIKRSLIEAITRHSLQTSPTIVAIANFESVSLTRDPTHAGENIAPEKRFSFDRRSLHMKFWTLQVALGGKQVRDSLCLELTRWITHRLDTRLVILLYFSEANTPWNLNSCWIYTINPDSCWNKKNKLSGGIESKMTLRSPFFERVLSRSAGNHGTVRKSRYTWYIRLACFGQEPLIAKFRVSR